MDLLRQFANARIKMCTAMLLVFVLVVSNTGFAFNVHFCGGSVASVSLKPEVAKAGKSCCGMKVPKSDCCKNKVVHFQKKADNTLVKAFVFQTDTVLPIEITQPIPFAAIPTPQSDSNTAYYCEANAPPLFKLYSQYIFYDRF